MKILFLAGAAGGTASNNWLMIIMFVVLIGFTYFGMIRPQKKQQRQRMQMMDRLKKGDQVVLVDGLHGKIDQINSKDRTVVVDADGIYLTFERMAIRRVIPAATAADQTAKKSTTEKQASAPAKKDQPTTTPDQSKDEK